MRTNRISDSRARRFKIEADARYLEFLRDSSIVDCRLHVVQPYRSNYPLAFSAKITKCDPDDRAFSSACNASDSHLKTRDAKSSNGLIAGAIHAGDGTSLGRVIGKKDAVATGLGPGRIGQHIDDPSAWPIFSSAPAINDGGDIAFIAALHPDGDSQVEWGTAVFVASAAADPIFSDGLDSR